MKRFFILILMSFLIACSHRGDSRQLYAIRVTCGDFDPSSEDTGRGEVVPANVASGISEAINRYRVQFEIQNLNVDDSEIIKSIFKISLDSDISIYLFKTESHPAARYFFFAQNNLTNKISQVPFEMNGTFMDERGFQTESRLVNKPYISLGVLEGVPGEVLFIKQRAHNGTAYNAVIEHYFSLDPDMNFRKIISVESLTCVPTNEDCIIQRRLKSDTLNVVLKCNDSERQLGWAKVNWATGKCAETYISDSEYSSVFFTASGITDSTFMRSGLDSFIK